MGSSDSAREEALRFEYSKRLELMVKSVELHAKFFAFYLAANAVFLKFALEATRPKLFSVLGFVGTGVMFTVTIIARRFWMQNEARLPSLAEKTGTNLIETSIITRGGFVTFAAMAVMAVAWAYIFFDAN